ncbi:hypothetical protein EZV62_017128 [Acer yangbiense]|uniref:Pectate lyase superfamily protein domain-containing protein n=1 Tax=Acer yangbiense TaxID=1000413 RepID=A0A5C7HGK7_9ROSI|nr:hypothetical protein EZV62_017128 [Acer yangbiense]
MFSKSCLITLCLIILVSFSSSTFGSYLDYYDNPNPATLKSKSRTTSSSFRRSFFKTRPLASSSSPSSAKVVNVDSFGAKGDGTDDSQAFKRAWQEACSSSREAVLVVPKNKIYYLKPLRFSGPCKSSLTMKIYGTIKASVRLSDYQKDLDHWIVFDNVNNFRVDGSGTIDGSGRFWWQNSCKINENLPCKDAPTVSSYSRLRDDCISIVSGSKNVRATDITCGPGHGISIGSLGAGNSEAEVSDVMVNRAKFSGTTNGVRIKTWQGGSGYAKNIIFQNIEMNNVSNPIIIDQHYCDQDGPCPDQGSAVQVSNVAYKNIRGTSASELAIKFDCSKHFACQGILVQDVILAPQQEDSAQASCVNVKLQTVGSFSPRC